MELMKSNQQSSIVLNEKEIEIAKSIYHVNLFMPYPLNKTQIEDWSKCINEILPNLELSILKEVIAEFKKCTFEWDSRKGIQNIMGYLIQRSQTPEQLKEQRNREFLARL